LFKQKAADIAIYIINDVAYLTIIEISEIIYFCVAANGWIGTMLVNNC